MSHEWDCRCPRCNAEEAKYEGEDPRTDEEQERAAFAEGRSAYDPDVDRG